MLPGSNGGICVFEEAASSARVGSSWADGTLTGSPGGAAQAPKGCGAGGAGGAGGTTVAAGVGDGSPGAPPAIAGGTGEASATLGAPVDTEDAAAAVLAADGVAPTHALPTGVAAARIAVAALGASDCWLVAAEGPGWFISTAAAGCVPVRGGGGGGG